MYLTTRNKKIADIWGLSYVKNKCDMEFWSPSNLRTMIQVITDTSLSDYYYIVKRIYDIIVEDKEDIIQAINMGTSYPKAEEIIKKLEIEIKNTELRLGHKIPTSVKFFSWQHWRIVLWSLKRCCV